MTEPKMLTTTQAAQELGYSDDKVRRLCERGVFPDAIKDGPGGHWRIPMSDLVAWREACRPKKRARA